MFNKSQVILSSILAILTALFFFSCSKKPTAPSGLQTGTVTDIDGNVYKTVKIGDQWWMAENLKVTHYRNGATIPNITDSASWNNLTTEAFCNYNNDENNVATYGRLYNWFAVNDLRNIAPEGWHVASLAEWQTLVYHHLGPIETAGIKMREASTTHWLSDDYGATNESGFTALPGGFRDSPSWHPNPEHDFADLGGGAYFWTSHYFDELSSHMVIIGPPEVYITWLGGGFPVTGGMGCGYSIRCVKDSSIPVVVTGLITDTTHTSVVCGYTVLSSEDSPVLSNGLCWSESYEFQPNDTHMVEIGTGLGTFSYQITGLWPGAGYYVRAYATNDAGTGYGDVSQFSTFPIDYHPTTDTISAITRNSAVCGGYIGDDIGLPVTGRGVCWSTAPEPSIFADTTYDGVGTGPFTSHITGLSPSTTYFVRAYARYELHTIYGNQRTFRTLTSQ
jgi:uncharacterized protein (TIGR02145 family)